MKVLAGDNIRVVAGDGVGIDKLDYDTSTNDLGNDARRTALEVSAAPDYRRRSAMTRAEEEVNGNGERQDYRSRIGFNLCCS